MTNPASPLRYVIFSDSKVRNAYRKESGEESFRPYRLDYGKDTISAEEYWLKDLIFFRIASASR